MRPNPFRGFAGSRQGPGMAGPRSSGLRGGPRQLMQAVLLDTKGAVDALPHSGCVVWVPADPSCLGRVLTGFIHHGAESLVPTNLRLLIPVEAFPECSQIQDLTDL